MYIKFKAGKNMGHSKKNHKEDKEFANEHDRCVKLGSIALEGVYIWSFWGNGPEIFLFNNFTINIGKYCECACEVCLYRQNDISNTGKEWDIT